MSSSRFGMTKDSVGSLVKSVGNAVKGWLTECARSEKSVQGTCFRAYSPETQTCDPGEGRLSEYPTKVFFAAMNCAPRFDAVNVCGHESSVILCVDPENKAR